MAAMRASGKAPAWPRGALRRIVTTGLLIGLLAPAAAAQDASAYAHVRGLDESARRLIVEAHAASQTVARLVAALDASDVIVLASVTFMNDGVEADTRFISVTPRARILSVRIDRLAAPWDKIAYLGHELQHAVEVASARQVKSDADLRKLLTRIGRKCGAGRQFETDGAIQVALHVRQEIGAPPAK